MKKILVLALTSVILVSCGKDKAFDKNLQESFKEVTYITIFGAYSCEKISSTWRKAIYDEEDFNGDYCSDFNVALRQLIGFYQSSGILDTLYTHKSNMEKYATNLNNPPSNRKDCYNDFIEIVSDANSIYRMATDPSGSLQSYNNQTNEAFESIKKKLDVFSIKYGEFLKEK